MFVIFSTRNRLFTLRAVKLHDVLLYQGLDVLAQKKQMWGGILKKIRGQYAERFCRRTTLGSETE